MVLACEDGLATRVERAETNLISINAHIVERRQRRARDERVKLKLRCGSWWHPEAHGRAMPRHTQQGARGHAH
jgi:hypothetical protein